LSIIIHVYAGLWIKGSVDAMMHGRVSRAWARKHHLLWYREVTREDAPPRSTTKKG
jgi:formate dehydrogenase subunit gamma